MEEGRKEKDVERSRVLEKSVKVGRLERKCWNGRGKVGRSEGRSLKGRGKVGRL